jgi:hypothetical protein
MFAAILRASSSVSSFAADRPSLELLDPGLYGRDLSVAVISFFWDCGEKAVISSVVRVISNDLSGIVDAVGDWAGAPWWIDARVLPVAVNKSVLWLGSATGLIIAGDLPFIIDAYGHGGNSAGKIDIRVSTIAVNKAFAQARYSASNARRLFRIC